MLCQVDDNHWQRTGSRQGTSEYDRLPVVILRTDFLCIGFFVIHAYCVNYVLHSGHCVYYILCTLYVYLYTPYCSMYFGFNPVEMLKYYTLFCSEADGALL